MAQDNQKKPRMGMNVEYIISDHAIGLNLFRDDSWEIIYLTETQALELIKQTRIAIADQRAHSAFEKKN